MDEKRCSEYYVTEDDEGGPLCICPECGAFLPRRFPTDEPFECKKCGTQLMAFPDKNEGDSDEEESGRICPIGNKKWVGTYTKKAVLK